MRRFICTNVEDVLAEKIISDYNKTISGVLLKLDQNENKLVVECI